MRMHINYKIETGIEQKAAFPKRVIFFRDGVSEGQFKHVIEDGMYHVPSFYFQIIESRPEIPKIKGMCVFHGSSAKSNKGFSCMCIVETPRRA